MSGGPVRVVELSSPVSAPCGRMLAEAGLEVILVEEPGGAPGRRDDAGSLTRWSRFHDAGKRSLELELAEPHGRDAFSRLVAQADVLLEGMRPGALEALGLGYETLSAANPGLVVASITPFGQTGPYRGLPAGDLVAAALGGVMFISGEPSSAPVRPPDRQSYVLAGAHAAFGVLAALHAREADGRGDWVDVSMLECWAAQENTITNFLGPGEFARRAGSQHRTSLPGRIFACRDGVVHLFISRDPPVWERFLRWIGDPPQLRDPALAEINTRWAHAELVDRVTEALLRERDARELFESAQEAHLPCVPVYAPAEFLADPQTVAADLVATLTDGRRTLRPALPDGFAPAATPAPMPGEHGDEILAALGDDPGGPAAAARRRRNGAGARAPLADVRVCAFTHVAAGPYATLQLAYLGAEVIKVESRTRIDYWRYRDRNNDPERSRTFADHNKNVRSTTLNLRTAEGLELARRLAASSDVVIDNFSAGVTDRLGLGYDDLRTLRPDTIVVHMTGLGSSGPRAHYVTFGPSLMAFCGMTHLWNHPGTRLPVGSQSSYPDFLAGAYAAFAMLAALRRRRATGEGALIDLSQAAVTAAAIGPSMLAALDGEDPVAIGNTSREHAPHDCYRCAGEDDWCVIAVQSDGQWAGLSAAAGNPAWAADPRLATAAGRRAHRAALDVQIAAWTTTLPGREVAARCSAHGVPAAIVATGEDLASDPQLRARGFLVSGSHPRLGGLRLPGSPIRLRNSATGVWRFGPLLGEDTDEVLRSVLGLDAGEIEAFAQAGALE